LNDFDAEDRLRFEQLVLPHVDAAFNLARWLLRSRADAEDVAQQALLRSYRFFRCFQGGDARAWLLQIVRNTCYTLAGEESPHGTKHGIRRRVYTCRPAPHLKRSLLPVMIASA